MHCNEPEPSEYENSDNKNVLARAGLQAIGGIIPFAGGLLSAIAGVWGEHEQQKAYDFLAAQMKMLQDEIKEKQRVLLEITSRVDLHDEEINKRVRSDEYQSLMRKAFRNWAGTESRTKQEYVRNVLSNAAAGTTVSDDVVSLFIEWLQKYSEFHFAVIGAIYNSEGVTRLQIWEKLGKAQVREDSAEADLFKLLIYDLSVGHVIRQHRETDYHGNFIKKERVKASGSTSRTMASAFDNQDGYELTALGQQFVHYAMTELTPKISYQTFDEDENIQPNPNIQNPDAAA